MKTVNKATSCGEVKYTVPVSVTEGATNKAKLADLKSHYAENASAVDFDGLMVRCWEDCQRGGQLQGSKGSVRGAEAGKEDAAIAAHLKKAASFLYGVAAKRGEGGVTQKQRIERDKAASEFKATEGRRPNDDEMDSIEKKLGIIS